MGKLLTVDACVGTWWGNEGHTSRVRQHTSLNHQRMLCMQDGMSLSHCHSFGMDNGLFVSHSTNLDEQSGITEPRLRERIRRSYPSPANGLLGWDVRVSPNRMRRNKISSSAASL